MIAPPCATVAPLGAGAHCDTSALQKWEFSDNCVQAIQHNRNRGMPQWRGAPTTMIFNDFHTVCEHSVHARFYRGEKRVKTNPGKKIVLFLRIT